MTIFNAKDIGLTGMNLQPTSKVEEKLCYMYGSIMVFFFEVSNHDHIQTHSQQLQHMPKNNIRNNFALINKKNVVLLYFNARPHSSRITQKKILDLG